MITGRQNFGTVLMAQQESIAAQSFGYGFATAQNPVWTLADVLLATGGRLESGRSTALFRAVATDSRAIETGDLFLALVGDRFDGHAFIHSAVQNGAAGVIVSKLPDNPPPVPIILVPNTLHALGDLAGYRRAQMPRLQVIGITGSSGKTTVKEMTAAIFEGNHKVLKTQGNFNNLVGMPLSLLPVDYAHDVAVLEMGMNVPGEIARLTEIADPDIGCIVNIQSAHLAGLKDIQGVAAAKGELYQGMKAWGKLVVNQDDPNVRRLARRCKNNKITFGRGTKAFVRATHVKNCGEGGMLFTLHIGGDKTRVQIRGLGEHNVNNALAAAAITHGAGLPLNEISAGLTRFRPYDKRLQVQKTDCGLKVVNDTYNANPASMLAALQTLKGLSRDSRSVAVLGDMLELGQESLAAHRFVGESVARIGFDYLLVVGSFARSMVEAAQQGGMPADQAKFYESKEEAVEALRQYMQQGKLGRGDYILVKGSRGMQMETVVAELNKLKPEAQG